MTVVTPAVGSSNLVAVEPGAIREETPPGSVIQYSDYELDTSSPFAGGVAWIEGEYMPAEEAKISIFDTGFGHSDVTYTVAHVWHGNVFRLGDHLDRLLDGAAKLRLDAGMSKGEELAEITKKCISMSQLRESFVNLSITRGYGKKQGREGLVQTHPSGVHLRDPLSVGVSARPSRSSAPQPSCRATSVAPAATPSTRPSRTISGAISPRPASRPRTAAPARQSCSTPTTASPRDPASTSSSSRTASWPPHREMRCPASPARPSTKSPTQMGIEATLRDVTSRGALRCRRADGGHHSGRSHTHQHPRRRERSGTALPGHRHRRHPRSLLGVDG